MILSLPNTTSLHIRGVLHPKSHILIPKSPQTFPFHSLLLNLSFTQLVKYIFLWSTAALTGRAFLSLQKSSFGSYKLQTTTKRIQTTTVGHHHQQQLFIIIFIIYNDQQLDRQIPKKTHCESTKKVPSPLNSRLNNSSSYGYYYYLNSIINISSSNCTNWFSNYYI